MTEKEIIAGEKLIAYFVMGAKCLPVGITKAEDLKYHSDWNWLMVACSKWDWLYMKEIGLMNEKEYIRKSNSLAHSLCFYEPILVFEQLVDNIKWYNNFKKN